MVASAHDIIHAVPGQPQVYGICKLSFGDRFNMAADTAGQPSWQAGRGLGHIVVIAHNAARRISRIAESP